LRRKFHYTFPEALDYWASTNLAMAQAAGPLGDRFALLRYEDLVVHGEPVLRELVRFLDEPWSPDLLRHHQVQRDKGVPRAAEGSTIVSDPIDADRAAQWATDVGPEDLDALRSVAAVASLFSYDVSSPEVLPPQLGEEGRGSEWLAGGDELLERCRSLEAGAHGQGGATVMYPDADPRELALALARTQQALARVRSRRTVRWVDALRRVQHGRSVDDVRAAWALVRGSGRELGEDR
jgi:hypothetical protein